ncbi:MAG: hypothetical protein N3A69_15020 [Leptospiraceae bacterium]|nr:hypothetical protein [Leptospiraceae bacterium]
MIIFLNLGITFSIMILDTMSTVKILPPEKVGLAFSRSFCMSSIGIWRAPGQTTVMVTKPPFSRNSCAIEKENPRTANLEVL